jgi:hypothetical protein
MDVLFEPLFVGMVISIGLCIYRSTRSAQPSFWTPFLVAFLMGVAWVFVTNGLSLFTPSFWHQDPFFAPSVPVEIFLEFCLFAFLGFVPSLLVVLIYRMMFDE